MGRNPCPRSRSRESGASRDSYLERDGRLQDWLIERLTKAATFEGKSGATTID